MQMSLPHSFRIYKSGLVLILSTTFKTYPFPIPKQAFPEVLFVLSKVFLFHPESGVLTFCNQGNKKMQVAAHGSC